MLEKKTSAFAGVEARHIICVLDRHDGERLRKTSEFADVKPDTHFLFTGIVRGRFRINERVCGCCTYQIRYFDRPRHSFWTTQSSSATSRYWRVRLTTTGKMFTYHLLKLSIITLALLHPADLVFFRSRGGRSGKRHSLGRLTICLPKLKKA